MAEPREYREMKIMLYKLNKYHFKDIYFLRKKKFLRLLSHDPPFIALHEAEDQVCMTFQ